jgi:hypothetical protein
MGNHREKVIKFLCGFPSLWLNSSSFFLYLLPLLCGKKSGFRYAK